MGVEVAVGIIVGVFSVVCGTAVNGSVDVANTVVGELEVGWFAVPQARMASTKTAIARVIFLVFKVKLL